MTSGTLTGRKRQIFTINARGGAVLLVVAWVVGVPHEISAQTFTSHTPFSDYAWYVRAADIDGDSDLDLVACDQSGEMSWWENSSGDGSTWSKNVVQANGDANNYWWQSWSAFPADMDGDGDIDIVGGTGHPDPGYNTYQINWWENSGDGSSWTRHLIDEEDRSQSPAFLITLYWAEPGDIDNDGDIDVAVANYDSIAWYENGGSGSWTLHTLDTTMYGAHGAHPTDIDGDGELEIVGCSYYMGQVKIYESGGSVIFSDYPSGGAWGATSFDADGDSDVDLAIMGSYGMEFYLNNNNSSLSSQYSSSSTGGYSITAADVDGDGDVDIAGGFSLTWWENNGSGTSWTETSLGNTNVTGHDTADLSGDGKIDIPVAYDSSANMEWLEQD